MSYKRIARNEGRKVFGPGRDTQIFLRQMNQEAGFRDATSPAGAQGPAQIMPATAAGWGVRNVHDPHEAYAAAAKHMKAYLDQYGGSWAKALTAYNAGPGAVGHTLPAETTNYIHNILGGGGDVRAGAPSPTGPGPRTTTTTTPARAAAAQIAPIAPDYETSNMLQKAFPQGKELLKIAFSGSPAGPTQRVSIPGMTKVTHSASPGKTLYLGDSLGVGTLPHLKGKFGGQLHADVKVGRSSAQGLQILKAKGGNYQNIVLDLGTNDGSAQQLRRTINQARRLAPNAQIYVATVPQGAPDAARKNQVIRGLQGVTVINTSGIVPGGDHIHYDDNGYTRRAKRILNALGVDQQQQTDGVDPHAKAGKPTTQTTSVGGLHETDGLPGFPAHDYMAPAGTAAVAPVSGKVYKLSGHDPAAGPPNGPHGPFGYSVYIQGDDGRRYYLTHMGSRNVQVGQTVRQGQKIGTVGNYAKWGGADHIHMGVNG